MVALLVLFLVVCSTTFQVLAQPAIAQDISRASHTNDFHVLFDFEDVAPTCCPGPLPTCGDGKCNRTENCRTCPEDCTCLNCGDGLCMGSDGENCKSCPLDCGKCEEKPVCGDSVCSHKYETCVNCAADCGKCVECGDGVCEFTENCATCPLDCGGACSSGTLVGRVVDITTNLPIPDALVSTVHADPADQFQQSTNSLGNFFFPELPASSVELRVTHSSYASLLTTVEVNTVATGNITLYLAPLLPTGYWRIRLDWNLKPADLDLFLFGDFGSTYRSGVVGWETPDKTADLPFASYTGDRTLGFGPEHLTITKWSRPRQSVEVWVNNYSNNRNTLSSLAGSGARVIAWTGNQGIVADISVPSTVQGNQTWWHVFDITPTQAVIPINDFYFGAAAPCGWSYCPYTPLDIFSKRKKKNL